MALFCHLLRSIRANDKLEDMWRSIAPYVRLTKYNKLSDFNAWNRLRFWRTLFQTQTSDRDGCFQEYGENLPCHFLPASDRWLKLWLVSELFQILPHLPMEAPYIFGSVSIFLRFIEVSVILDLCLSKFLFLSFIISKNTPIFLTRFHSKYQKIRISETPTVFKENHVL